MQQGGFLDTGGNELNIHLEAPSRHGCHRVTARVLPSGTSAEGSFRLPFAEEELDQARAWLQKGLHDDPHVYAFGARLFAALIDGEVMTGYQAAQLGGRPARCRLSFDDPSLHRVPWELLYDRSGFSSPVALPARARPASLSCTRPPCAWWTATGSS
jgi:hypothetical protein